MAQRIAAYPCALEPLVGDELAWPIRGAIGALGEGEGLPSIDRIDRCLGPAAGVRFVPAAPRPRRARTRSADQLYDGFIATRSQVPTRAGNLHDVMNALVWSVFPRSKRALHELQHRLVRERMAPDGRRLLPHRSREQDAIAMLDEGGIIVVATPSAKTRVEQALRDRDRDELSGAVQRREAQGIVFGHALYEHLAHRRGGVVWGKTALFEVVEPHAIPLPDVDLLLAALLCHTTWKGFIDDSGSAPLSSGVLGTRELAS